MVSRSRICRSFKRDLFASCPPKITKLVPTRVTDWPPREICNAWNMQHFIHYISNQYHKREWKTVEHKYSIVIHCYSFASPTHNFISSVNTLTTSFGWKSQRKIIHKFGKKRKKFKSRFKISSLCISTADYSFELWIIQWFSIFVLYEMQ
jgi:hypothetical protein